VSPKQGKMVIRRILVPLDESRHSRAALEAATVLAAALKAELCGLFVEDSDLLAVSQYPFFREVCTYDAQPLRAVDLERDFRLQAERLRRMIGALADSHEVIWTFEVRRGGVRTVIVEQTGTADLTVIGRFGRTLLRSTMGSTVRHLITHGRGTTLILQEGLRLISPVMAVYTGSDLSARALDIAVHLARASGGLLEVLIPSGTRDVFQEKKKEVDGRMSDAKDVSVICHPLRTPALRGLMQLLQSKYRQPLVLPVDAVDGKPGELLLLIDRITNPVLLVR